MVTFRWVPGVTAQQVAAFGESLDGLRASVPLLVDYRHGPDLGLREGNGDYGIIAFLANPEDVPAYLDHPAHIAAVRAHPDMIAERTSVQFELASALSVG